MEKKRYLRKTQHLYIYASNEEQPWNEAWNIVLRKNENVIIGTVSFEGEKEYGNVPIRVALEEEYRNKGYGTEVLQEMVRWAFLNSQVYEVTAVTEHFNDKYVHALSKAGFVRRGGENGYELYSITKQKSDWTGVYVVIGIMIGLILSVVLASPVFGFAIGILVCVLTGVIKDTGERKDRKNTMAGRQ